MVHYFYSKVYRKIVGDIA